MYIQPYLYIALWTLSVAVFVSLYTCTWLRWQRSLWTLTVVCFPKHRTEHSIYLFGFLYTMSRSLANRRTYPVCVFALQRDAVSICSLNLQEIELSKRLQVRAIHKHFLQRLIRFLWSNSMTVSQPLQLMTRWRILEQVQHWWKTRCDSTCPTATGWNCFQRQGVERPIGMCTWCQWPTEYMYCMCWEH